MARYLVKGAKVLTLTRENPVIDNGAIIVRGDSIEHVGPEDVLRRQGPFDSEVGSRDVIVMPGFTNAHYHAGNTVRVGFQDAPLETWLLRSHGAGGNRAAESIYDATQYYACEMIRAGITCCINMMPMNHGLPEYGVEPVLKAYADLGLRVALGPIVRTKSTYVLGDDDAFLSTMPAELAEWARASRFARLYTNEDDYINTMQSIFTKYDGGAEGKWKIFLSPSGVQWCSDSMLQKIKRAAREWNTGIQLHVLESRYQMQYALKEYGKTSVAHLAELGFLGEEVSCAHTVWATDDDIKILADSGATVAHNPASNLRLGSGIARIRDMLAAGVTVAVGTDGMSAAGTNDLLSDLRLADQLQRLPGITAPRVDSQTWFEAVTIKGAQAALFGKDCGSLEAGKKADLVLINTRRMFRPYIREDLPITDILLQFVTSADVDTVIVNGKPIMQGGQLQTINEDALVERLKNSFTASQGRAGSDLSMLQAIESHAEAYYAKWDEEPLENGYQYNTR